jgi:glycosyltransferase involved in cell wall biosynthesis
VALRIFAIPPWELLTDHVPYGDGLVAYAFLRELAERGHDVHVAAQGVDLREPVPANLHLYRLGEPGRASPAGRLGLMLRARRLHRRLQRAAPFDVVHQLNPVDVGVSLAVAGARAPLVLGPYVPDWPASAQVPGAVDGPAALRAKRVLRAAQQRRATMLLLSSPAAESKVEPGAPPGLMVRELSYGIDETAWVPGAGGGGQDVLFLSNLEIRKGIHMLLDAFELLAERLPEARLLVAGDGTEAAAVRERVRSAPGLDRVELLGWVERDRVMATLHACDVYCAPSDGEPFGMAALEAMACAKPIVATDAGGLRHLVPDGGGRRVPPGDPAALAEALHEVLADPALRRSLGEHNRRVVEERYAWSRVVDRLEELYQEAIRAGTVRAA